MSSNERMNYENDSKNDSINTKDFIIGALVGGIVGSLTALLFAPKSGKELRHDLNNGTYMLKEKTDHLRTTAVEKSGELTSTVKDKTTALSKKVSEQSAEIVKKVKGIRSDESDSMNPVDELFEQDPRSEIQKKLEETKKAFDETEGKLNQH